MKLFKKEIKLAMHPTALIFLSFSAMLLIPNYPYYTAFFYTALGIFFTCLTGRENNDILYSMLLPVKKTDIVKARFTYVIVLEILQLIVAIPFAILRSTYPAEILQNGVGTNANITLFGFVLIMLGLFNLVFFNNYYKNVLKVGSAFVKGATLIFSYMLIVEVLMHFPFTIIDKANSFTPNLIQFIILGIGIVVYVLLTFLSYKKSQKSFEMLDI